jgi:hypothetical protein
VRVIYLIDAFAAVEKIVGEVGHEYTYQRPVTSHVACRYWHPSAPEVNAATSEEIKSGAPGCIVGRVLHEVGMAPLAINSLDGRGAIGTCHSRTEEHGIRLTPAAAQFLQQVQFKQDSGNTWAEAVAYGKGYMDALDQNQVPGVDE